jgi:glucokinase
LKVDFNMSMSDKYFIGVDIGGSHTAIGLVDDYGMVIDEQRFNTADYIDVNDYIELLVNNIYNIIKKFDVSQKLEGIGIGAPNGNFYSGSIEEAPNLPWRGVIPLAKLLENRLSKYPVKLTNDANAAAIGEMEFGIAKYLDIKDFIMITLGTGLGSGVIVDGQLVYGHDGFAGELGHSIIDINGGRLCACGRYGCLERYASATGIVITAKEELAKNELNSVLSSKINHLSSIDIAIAASQGDQLALNVFDKTAKILAFALANACAVTSPKAFVLFGGLANSGDLLLIPLKKYFKEFLANMYKDKVEILLSSINENQAAILGAAALIRKSKN